MAKEKGNVNEFLEPCIHIEFGNGKTIEFVIDIGFNGSLCVPRSLMDELDLVKVSEEIIYGVGDLVDILDLSVAEISWFGERIIVNVLINDGDDKLLGSQLLNNKILNINYQNDTLTVSE